MEEVGTTGVQEIRAGDGADCGEELGDRGAVKWVKCGGGGSPGRRTVESEGYPRSESLLLK